MRVKTRKNFRELKQYKQQVHKPKKGSGSYSRKVKPNTFIQFINWLGFKTKELNS